MGTYYGVFQEEMREGIGVLTVSKHTLDSYTQFFFFIPDNRVST